MAEYQSMTIYDLIDKINNQELILPAMQRNFVWPEEKIYHLFDSLIRDYPIGTFLFWDVKKEAFEQYAFNQFIKDVQESKDKLYRGPAVIQDHSRYSSVLDGQQRITSIYIGIMGKWKTHEKRKNGKILIPIMIDTSVSIFYTIQKLKKMSIFSDLFNLKK